MSLAHSTKRHDIEVMGYINEKKNPPWWVKLLLWFGDLGLKRRLKLTRILAHHPKSLVSVGVMEALVAHHDREVSKRQLQLIRLQVSLRVACPFCVDMNAQQFWRNHVTQQEFEALLGKRSVDSVSTFLAAERAVSAFVDALCQTPVAVTEDHVTKLKEYFSERGIVIIATTIAQVNLWTRLIQGLGLTPEGFTPNCQVRLEHHHAQRQIEVTLLP